MKTKKAQEQKVFPLLKMGTKDTDDSSPPNTNRQTTIDSDSVNTNTTPKNPRQISYTNYTTTTTATNISNIRLLHDATNSELLIAKRTPTPIINNNNNNNQVLKQASTSASASTSNNNTKPVVANVAVIDENERNMREVELQLADQIERETNNNNDNDNDKVLKSNNSKNY
jgi:hypothetical protein